MQAQETAREQANFAAGQAGLAAQAQANTTGNASVASPSGSSQLNSQVEALKAAGIQQQNAENAAAIGQAGIAAQQAQEMAREQANFFAGQAALAAEAQSSSSTSTGTGTASTATTGSNQVDSQTDSLKAAGVAQQNTEAAASTGQAGIAAQQAQESAREQANFDAGQAGLAASSSGTSSQSSAGANAAASGGGASAGVGGHTAQGSQRNAAQ